MLIVGEELSARHSGMRNEKHRQRKKRRTWHTPGVEKLQNRANVLEDELVVEARHRRGEVKPSKGTGDNEDEDSLHWCHREHGRGRK